MDGLSWQISYQPSISSCTKASDLNDIAKENNSQHYTWRIAEQSSICIISNKAVSRLLVIPARLFQLTVTNRKLLSWTTELHMIA